MSSLLIKNIPTELHSALKKRAAAHRRSLNSETILILEQAVGQKTHPTPSSACESPAATLDETTLASFPPEIAQRLRALKTLRESLAARNADFAAWRQTAAESRR